ncbi:hypothetical protein CYLTODRAFT_387691 [Cylindrobasidium torrendii FP15055 ss-10]|uniref:NEDD8-activating enzyme E1 regulatory subunit n=1 Tax=Cylindrobasidium torrendii FP15055 ss-10 TaxID=1314674 RepID=A0A0D7BRU5_9AGAR|nr:hypothetical protein CYLTODRAFT_387691 [Cylindrobasidium torrendii FP15055 ss-10]
MTTESQDISDVITSAAPDAKTRRYDRQLRLWASTGQARLEEARLLVLSASATSTSILKNLVLPGVGHFTILDDAITSAADAGNNFFLEGPSSIGKPRAQEAVRLLLELNDGVVGEAITDKPISTVVGDLEFLSKYTIVIAHNLPPSQLDTLSKSLWSTASAPILLTVNSSGFLAEIFIQHAPHPIIESHTESLPSLRIYDPFPALLEYSKGLDLDNMDPTVHAHVPYIPILIHARSRLDGIPKTSEEKAAFKKSLLELKKKQDEENFDEAYAQAYRVWAPTPIPSNLTQHIFPHLEDKLAPPVLPPSIHGLLVALKRFTEREPHVLPLSPALPDMKASTESYIHLQRMYKDRFNTDKEVLKSLIPEEAGDIPDDLVDTFIKNAHGVQVVIGEQYGAFDKDPSRIANALEIAPKDLGVHLALQAVREEIEAAGKSGDALARVEREALTKRVLAKLAKGTELSEEIEEAIGEVIRAPVADIPNTAAMLGGMVAQEAIKMITRQYVPQSGYCVVDCIDMRTGVLV